MGRFNHQIRKWDNARKDYFNFNYTYPVKEAGVIILTYMNLLPEPKSDKVNSKLRYYPKKNKFWIDKSLDCYRDCLNYKFQQRENTWSKDKDNKLINIDVFRADNIHPTTYKYGSVPTDDISKLNKQVFYDHVRLYGLENVRGSILSKPELSADERQFHNDIAFSENEYGSILDLN